MTLAGKLHDLEALSMAAADHVFEAVSLWH